MYEAVEKRQKLIVIALNTCVVEESATTCTRTASKMEGSLFAQRKTVGEPAADARRNKEMS